jgi:NADH-quinone oxidoreductase subunit K
MIHISQFFYSLRFPLILFLISIFGLFATRKNMIIVLMSIELMLLSSTYSFVFLSIYLDDIGGQLFALMILTVAAAESAIGLALVVLHYRHKAVISIDTISYLKG